MRINTDPIVVTKNDLIEKKTNAELGLQEFQKEVESIDAMTKEEVAEAERIESLLFKLKRFRKLESKQKAVVKQQERVDILNKEIQLMESEGVNEKTY